MSAQGRAWYPASFKVKMGKERETHPAGLLGRLGIFKGMFSVECW